MQGVFSSILYSNKWGAFIYLIESNQLQLYEINLGTFAFRFLQEDLVCRENDNGCMVCVFVCSNMTSEC